MTIYVLTTGEYSDYRICSVCSTREKAETLRAEYVKVESAADIEEYELDKEVGSTAQGIFVVCINLADGTVFNGSHPPGNSAEPCTSLEVCTNEYRSIGEPYTAWWKGQELGKHIRVSAAGSLKRAVKLATEARQAYLREAGRIGPWERPE